MRKTQNPLFWLLFVFSILLNSIYSTSTFASNRLSSHISEVMIGKADTTSIDSVFYKHLNMNYGAYYNLLMGRYFSLDNYKGVKSTLDGGIIYRNIYSDGIPVVLMNGFKYPLLLLDYSTVLSTINRVDSVIFIRLGY